MIQSGIKQGLQVSREGSNVCFWLFPLEGAPKAEVRLLLLEEEMGIHRREKTLEHRERRQHWEQFCHRYLHVHTFAHIHLHKHRTQIIRIFQFVALLKI